MGSHPHPHSPGATVLCEKLKAEFTKGTKHDVPAVQKLLEAYIRDGNDWEEYTFFADQRYARNLIELNDHFELMVICWKPGQVSPIHNHANSSCWMGVARGELLEEYFHVQPRADGNTCELKKGEQHVMQRGLVGYINDEIAVHRIRPNTDSHLVSIHLYAPPIKRCQVYCPQLEKVSEAKMCVACREISTDRVTRCYHTIQKCPVEGAMAVEYVKVT